MAVTVAMYDKALARVGARLDALGLDINVRVFDRDGNFAGEGHVGPPDKVDYIWLSPDISMDGIQKTAFEFVLKCPSVKVMQTFNAGLDDPHYKRIAAKGIRICNSSAQAIAISEYVMAGVLGVFHPIMARDALQKSKTWERTPFREISRTNWLIAGFGPIGQEVAKRAKAFGATTTVVRRSPVTSDIVDRAGTLDDLDAFLPDADVIVLACPLNDATRGFAGADFFARVKPDAVLVNIARGALIDDDAMIAALDQGRLATAVLDVFHQEPLPSDHPLWSHPKVRMTAHTSFAGSGVRTRWDELFLDNIVRYVRGGDLVNEVNP
ncbi:MAG TPA: D-2-hydroxyacid dehydrogenase, partial [Hyphomicrobiaceae bacterium]|nr:D-2-hydroxyacid dehydrogenase [Hyphomicrobiaceae bacterium]